MVESVRELDNVSLGQIAGWPTAAQYRAAAARAIEAAEAIERRGAR